MKNQRKKEIMPPIDVFSLVMAFLTSAASLAAAYSARSAAEGAYSARKEKRFSVVI